jgi:hypothetical protein
MAPEANRSPLGRRRDLGAHGLGQSGRPAIGEHVLEHHLSAVGAGQRNPPVGVLVGGAGLVLGPAITHRVGQRHSQQPRRRSAQIPIKGENDQFRVVLPVTQQPNPSQLGRQLGPVRFELIFDGPSQQSQGLAQPHVVTGQVPGGRRQIVGGDRRLAVLPPALGR